MNLIKSKLVNLLEEANNIVDDLVDLNVRIREIEKDNSEYVEVQDYFLDRISAITNDLNDTIETTKETLD